MGINKKIKDLTIIAYNPALPILSLLLPCRGNIHKAATDI
jgi:hypothetical protein